jgi:hypothetical protein
MVQAFTAARTGLPGFAQGALDPVSRVRGQYDALRAMVAGFAGMPGHTERVRDPETGQIFTEATSARDVQIGAAANRLGINYDEARKMMATGGRANAMEVAQAATDQYAREAAMPDPQDTHAHRVAQRAQSTNPRVRNAQQTALQRSNEANRSGRVSVQTLERLARQADVDKSTIDDAAKAGDATTVEGRKKIAAAFRGAIETKQREDNAQYQIAFTGEAERYFKALAKKSGVNPPNPNEPANAPASTPQGPAPTGNPIPPTRGG